VAGGHDLATQISQALNAGDITSRNNADAMIISAITTGFNAAATEKSLQTSAAPLLQAYTIYDPQGRLDSQVLALQKNISTLVESAAKNGANLLKATQGDITLNVASQSGVLKLRAASGFEANYSGALQNVVANLATGGAGLAATLQQLKDVADNTVRQINGDTGRVNFEYAKTGTLLDSLKTEDNTPTGANATYKTNSYTYKFITRFLSLNGSSNFGGNISASSPNASALSLFDNSQNRLNNIMGNISSLSIQV
jgi:hypothetical protein